MIGRYFSAALAIISISTGCWCKQPTIGPPGQQRSMGDIMRQEHSRDGKLRPITFKKEREVDPLHEKRKPNPNALAGNSYTAESGPGTRIQEPAAEAVAEKAPQAIGTTWTAATLANTGAFPPDTMGAVGPTQFFLTINGRVRTFNKTTGAADGVLNADTDVFFSSVMTPVGVGGVDSNFTSDPHVFYDRVTKRWFMVIIDVPNVGEHVNRILLAVSDAASNGVLSVSTVWSFFFIPVASDFADYPTLGVDTNALYIGTNMFTADSDGTFVNTNAYVVRKSSLLNGGPIVFTTFTGLIDTIVGDAIDGPFTPQGVANFDASSTTGYLIGVSSAFFGELILRRVSDPGGSPSISANIPINVNSTALPVNVPHLGNNNGNSGKLDALDDRLFAAMMRNGQLWTAHNIGVASTGIASDAASRDAIRWYQLGNLTGSPTLTQSGTVFDASASNPLSMWIPTIAVSGQGHAAIGCSIAGAAFHVNCATMGRLAGDAGGTMQPPVIYTNSQSAYNPVKDPGGADGRRWGDYSYVSVDPTDDMTMYTVQEFSTDAATTYGCCVARLLAPPPSTPTSSSPNLIQSNTGNTTITVSASSSNGAAFFDPGASFPNHIHATISGVTVNDVFIVNATTVDIGINTTGAIPGLKNITVTNPDGQSRTGNLLLSITASLLLPDIRSFAGSLDFGSRQINTAGTRQFAISNDGGTPLTITSFSGLPSDGFSLVSPPSTPFNIPAGGTQPLTVSFQPTTGGSHSATLTIHNDDADTPALNVGMQGVGTDCLLPGLATSPASDVNLVDAVTAAPKVKSSATKGTSIKGKLTIAQTVLGSGSTATVGVPATTVSLYLLDSNTVPCQLPAPITQVITKAGKPGKPGLAAKTVKVSINLKLSSTPSVSGKFLLAVVDKQNLVLERNKADNFVFTGPLP